MELTYGRSNGAAWDQGPGGGSGARPGADNLVGWSCLPRGDLDYASTRPFGRSIATSTWSWISSFTASRRILPETCIRVSR